MPLKSLLRQSVNLVPWGLRAHIRQIPLVAGLQRWVVSRLIGSGEFDHVINAGPGRGLRVRISLPRDKAVWTGTYETAFVGAVAAAVPRGSVCLDVGGFHGFVSGVMALAGSGRVVCFEPMAANATAIRALAALNPSLPIELRAHAVGAQDGQASFRVMDENSMGKLESSAFQPQRSGKSIEIEIRTLDSLLAEGGFPPPALIKVDVEGAETEVLAGARGLLAEHRPRLFIEAHSPDLRAQCEEMLRGLGYAVRMLRGSGASADAAAGVTHLEAQFLP